jgi:hypothetical protein
MLTLMIEMRSVQWILILDVPPLTPHTAVAGDNFVMHDNLPHFVLLITAALIRS